MNILIDTEVLIWIQTQKVKFPLLAEQYLLNPQITKWISEVSFFEIAIKRKVGKLTEFKPTLSAYIRQVQEDGFHLLPISNQHIIAYDQIPFYEDHRDPFDRLILATALHENWPVMSADNKFSLYKDLINIIW